MSWRRYGAGVLLAVGGGSTLAATPVLLRNNDPLNEMPWLLGMGVFVATAAYTLRRLPRHPSAQWFAVAAGAAALSQGLDGAAAAAFEWGVGPHGFAWLTLAQQLTLALTVIAMAHLFGTFPDGRAHSRAGRVILRSLWWLLALPLVVLVTRATLLFPSYYDVAEITNPYAIAPLADVGRAAGLATSLSQAAFGVGLILLVQRYRRDAAQERRRIRWLTVPAIIAIFGVLLDVLVNPSDVLLTLLFVTTMVGVPGSISVALLRPDLLDVDVVLRKSLVYGLLWLAIAVAYVAAAAGLGVMAGQRFSVGIAITLTVVATLLFQPARRRLERLADRWVFGVRPDPADLITRLGAALEETVPLERLLPRMATTLEDGLGLRWARVRLEPAPPLDEEPVLAVPIELDDERIGVVECGPPRSGTLTAADQAVVATFARQAALAVRNVRLTSELERSRARLVRAQDAERRRIERNIHDGVQQDLVALTAQAGHARTVLQRDPAAGEASLVELQDGLRRVIGELRELAHGIHPSVLGDRGLLEAVEALASRSSVPVSVRADPSLRGRRFPEEVEGAGYFTVAEALANVSKHAAATQAEVRLAQADGDLRIAVEDDGTGFDLTTAVGEGLANLAERLAALGGRLEVASRPGGGTTVTARLRVSGG